MGLYSKVRVEFSEDCGEGVYNTYARESGSVGRSNVAGDLADAISVGPRPLAVLAEAVVKTYEMGNDAGNASPFLAAAKKLVAEWQEFDRKRDSDMSTEELLKHYPQE